MNSGNNNASNAAIDQLLTAQIPKITMHIHVYIPYDDHSSDTQSFPSKNASFQYQHLGKYPI